MPLLLRPARRAPRVAPRHHLLQERLVGLPAGEVAAAPQQQRLLQRLLEPPVALLAVTVLVRRRRVGRLPNDPVVPQQRPVAGCELLGLAVVMHRQRHPVGAVPRRHPAAGTPGALQARAQTREALRKAHAHMLPVRPRQHVVVQQVLEPLAGDGDRQVPGPREVRGAQPARLVPLSEEDLLGRPVLRLPLPHPPLQRPPPSGPRLVRPLALQPLQQGLGHQPRLTLEHRLERRPDTGQRVGPSSPPRLLLLRWQGSLPRVLPRRLAVHVRPQGRPLQGQPSGQAAAEFPNLRVAHRLATAHRQLPCSGCCLPLYLPLIVADRRRGPSLARTAVQWGNLIDAGGET
jgi:hypothetical protein